MSDCFVPRGGHIVSDLPDMILLGKNFWEEFPGVAGTEFEQLHHHAMYDRVAGVVDASVAKLLIESANGS